MMIIKPKGQICNACGNFTKKFIVCEACRRKTCVRCSPDRDFCPECYTAKQGHSEVDTYFREKYAKSA